MPEVSLRIMPAQKQLVGNGLRFRRNFFQGGKQHLGIAHPISLPPWSGLWRPPTCTSKHELSIYYTLFFDIEERICRL